MTPGRWLVQLPGRWLAPLLLASFALLAALLNYGLQWRAMDERITAQESARLRERLGLEQTLAELQTSRDTGVLERRLVGSLGQYSGLERAWLVQGDGLVLASLSRADIGRPLQEVLGPQAGLFESWGGPSGESRASEVRVVRPSGSQRVVGSALILPDRQLLTLVDLGPALAAREAELRALSAQLNPHFLFNSLHSISALTAVDPAGARRMTILLGDFLRESLALGRAERIPLSKELALAHKYLDIERVRLGDRLQVSIDGDAAGACLVPPLLLQPIVENAVKHGVAHVLDGGAVTVSASCTAARLNVIVENPADAERPTSRAGTGMGLENVRARLRALFGSEASVRWSEENGRWRVEVALSAVRDEADGESHAAPPVNR